MTGRYRTIVADPPWQYPPDWGRSRHSGTAPGWREQNGVDPFDIPYPTLTVDEISALPVRTLADRDAHLYLWLTNHFVEHGWAIARAWGFEPSALLVWTKTPMGIGLGGAFTITTEFVLFARRGSPEVLRRMDSTWWRWPRTPHSVKPEAFIDMVEQVSPGPYVELFARRHRMGWDVWGDESANTADWQITDSGVAS